MLDLKFMRENKEQVEKWLKQRGSDLTLDEFAKLDEERREILGEVEALKNKSYAATYSGRQYGSVRSRMVTYEDYVAYLEKCLIKEFDYDVDKYKKEVLTYETI